MASISRAAGAPRQRGRGRWAASARPARQRARRSSSRGDRALEPPRIACMRLLCSRLGCLPSLLLMSGFSCLELKMAMSPGGWRRDVQRGGQPARRPRRVRPAQPQQRRQRGPGGRGPRARRPAALGLHRRAPGVQRRPAAPEPQQLAVRRPLLQRRARGAEAPQRRGPAARGAPISVQRRAQGWLKALEARSAKPGLHVGRRLCASTCSGS